MRGLQRPAGPLQRLQPQVSVEVTRKDEPIAIADDDLWALVGIALDSLALSGNVPCFQLSRQRRTELATRIVNGNRHAAPFSVTGRFT